LKSNIALGMLVDGGIISTCDATSSPSHINATKGTSVWLHWNYTYIGDGRHGKSVPFTSKYEEQIIGINCTSKSSIQALAKRIGQDGVLVLESKVPTQYHGRLGVISSNSTLVIYDLQYNDSICQFFSVVNVRIDIGAEHVLLVFGLKPTISLAVKGIPEFIEEPPLEFEVKESSTLALKIYMEGNPRPKASFKWTHLSTLSEVNVHIDSNPFQYYAEYKFGNVDASYCGRQLQATLENRLGLSPTKRIRVIVLCKL